jgi:prepilin-type N-terminal cleavage/methylation domain-containing protein
MENIMKKLPISKNQFRSGYTLVEILIVVFIFAILMVVVVQSLANSFKTTTKSENEITVRENIDYAINIIERNVRNAKTIDCPNSSTLNYEDQYGGSASFTCVPSGNINGRIASSSANLTTTDVYIDCSNAVFVCDPGGVGINPSVKILLEGRNANAGGSEQATVVSETTITLRSYGYNN